MQGSFCLNDSVHDRRVGINLPQSDDFRLAHAFAARGPMGFNQLSQERAQRFIWNNSVSAAPSARD